jgi:RHS repeat-associated protein
MGSGFRYTREETYTYSYNPISAPNEVERNDGKTWTYTYDEGNRLATEADENNSALGTLTLERTYDEVSNVTGLEIGTLVSLALTYDTRNLLASLTDPGGTSTFSHDDGGRLTEIATPEGSTRSFTYDPASRVTEVENVTDSGTEVLTYTYDANGNVLSENDTTYTYDALNRLSTWYDPVADVTTEYTYDAGGNLTSVEEDSVPVEAYTYNAGDQITNTGYIYDDNGSVTADGTRTYVYDEDKQLVQVLGGQTQIASMTYDMIGRRTSLTTSDGTTLFHYAGALLVAESDENGDVTATYTYSPEGGLLSMTRGTETYYYQTNVHGDVVSLTDDTGEIASAYSYDPWGKPLLSTGIVANPFRYAGYYYDSSTGLYYVWRRYYDPEISRFLTIDPAVLGTHDRYHYAWDNPTTLVDLTGATPFLCWLNSHLNPFAEDNPFRVDAYNGTWLSRQIGRFDPFVGALHNFQKAQDAAKAGASFGTCLRYHLLGVAETAGGVSLAVSSAQLLKGAASLIGSNWGAAAQQEGARVVFGHGSRHLIGTVFDRKMVEEAIESQIQYSVSKATNASGSFWGRATVEGQIIEYRAYALADGAINVGTYYVIP